MFSILRCISTPVLVVLLVVLVGAVDSASSRFPSHDPAKLRTVITTDMEQDDLASLVRYLLYTNDIDTQGIIYSSSKFHWSGNGNGTSLRWTGTRTIQDIVIRAYAEVYPNLRRHDPSYPTPNQLLSTVKVGNIAFESDMEDETEGSNWIYALLLDDDPRPVYLQAWGGTNTIARALKSIEERYSSSQEWKEIQKTISRKAVLIASGFQDNTYVDYIASHWPQVRVLEMSIGYKTWGYNCGSDSGNVRGLPDAHLYFTGGWIKPNIEMGPYGKLYRSWLDGQHMPGDPEDTFGNLTAVESRSTWCRPLDPYDFLSEGDNVAFNPILATGLQDPTNPRLGGWGGRSKQNTTSPDLWVMVDSDINQNGTKVNGYTTDRWMAAVQNDFAARMQWTVTPEYHDGNHAPTVEINGASSIQEYPGSKVILTATVHDPDQDSVNTSWWQYLEEGTYPGTVIVSDHGQNQASVIIPADAKPGQIISVILEATDSGQFPLTRYDRLLIEVQ